MKVALVYSNPVGGVKRYVELLIKGFSEIKADVEFVHFEGEQLGIPQLLTYDVLEDCINPSIEKKFEKFLIDEKPDVVNFQDIQGLGASVIGIAKDKGFPTIITLHDYWTICPRIFLLKNDLTLCDGPNGGASCYSCFHSVDEKLDTIDMVKFLERYRFFQFMLMEKTDQIIAVSNSIKDRMIQEGISSEKIVTIYPCIDIDEHLPKLQRDQNIDRPLRIGYIGAVSPHKGVHVLVAAFRKFLPEEAELYIYGKIDTIFIHTIKKLSSKNENIYIKGEYNRLDLQDIFNELDILVVPSVCPETGPLVVQEALRYGVPVIGSKIGGIQEYIEDSYGYLFESGNYRELEYILDNVIRQNRSVVKKWADNIPSLPSINNFADDIHRVYKEVLPNKNDFYINKIHTDLLSSQDKGFLRRQTIPFQLKKIVGFCEKENINTLVIFGAGELGKEISNFFIEKNFEILFLVDNDKNKWGTTYSNLFIENPSKLLYLNETDAIIIASDWEVEIMEQLSSMDIQTVVIGLYSFI